MRFRHEVAQYTPWARTLAYLHQRLQGVAAISKGWINLSHTIQPPIRRLASCRLLASRRVCVAVGLGDGRGVISGAAGPDVPSTQRIDSARVEVADVAELAVAALDRRVLVGPTRSIGKGLRGRCRIERALEPSKTMWQSG